MPCLIGHIAVQYAKCDVYDLRETLSTMMRKLRITFRDDLTYRIWEGRRARG